MPSFQRNPFEFRPREPDFSSSFPPMQQRGFPPLFPVRTPEPPAPTAPAASAGGFGDLISLFLSPGSRGGTGGMNLFSMLTNAQKAIQTAQSVLPMIQQFGPLIRNAPAILSALKSVPDSEKADTDPKENTNQAEEPPVPSDKEEKKETRPKPDVKKTAIRKVPIKDNLRNTEDMITRPSRPKLYI